MISAAMNIAHGINLGQLRMFVAVVDEGGFGAAAAVLGVTQPAVSHGIRALERTVGGAVIDRGGATAVATEYGAGLLPHARAAVGAADALGDLAAARHGSPRGLVRLAAPPTVCQGLLPRLVPQWAQSLPRVTVRVFEGEDDEVEEWLAAGSVEAAVLVDPPAHLPGTALAEDEFQVLLPRSHALAGEDAVTLAQIAKEPMLFSGGSCEQPIHDLYRDAGLRLTPTHQVRELSTLFAMVRSGMGITIVPGLVRAILDDELVLVALEPTHQRRLWLTGATGRPWHPAVTALVDAVAGSGRPVVVA
jgi:DNA-binding transcriptional LysR family regulator